MSILDTVFTKRQNKPPRGIIYGLPGIGKTTFGSGAKNALLLDCEGGANHVECAKTPYLSTWQEIKNFLVSLLTEEHKYNTIVIDTIDWAIRRLIEDVAGATKDPGNVIGDANGGWGKGYQKVENIISTKMFQLFNQITEIKNIGIILLAHAKTATITNENGSDIEKIGPDIPCGRKDNTILPLIQQWADFIFFAKMNQKGEREFITSDTKRHIAKNRYNITTPTIPMTWESFYKHVGVKNNGTNVKS